MQSDDKKIEVPLRLLKNLISCIEAQKTLSSSNIDMVTRQQMQDLIDNTKEWAIDLINAKSGTKITATDIQETLDFVKSDRRIKQILGQPDNESESSCVMVVEPDDSEGGFL